MQTVVPSAVSRAWAGHLSVPPETKESLLAALKQRKKTCTLRVLEDALEAWEFTRGRSKGHCQVWNYKGITFSMHKPHDKHVVVGAVSKAIAKIEEADVLQQEEKRKLEEKADVN
jgi:hypothetical protein